MRPDQHGTMAGYAAGCRRECCRAAHRVGTQHRRRQVAYGRWQPWTDASPAREHVCGLVAEHGMTVAEVARAADLVPQVVRYLLRGKPTTGNPPPARIRPATAHRLLSVEPATAATHGDAAGYVDGTGTRRRLQALVFMAHGCAAGQPARHQPGRGTQAAARQRPGPRGHRSAGRRSLQRAVATPGLLPGGRRDRPQPRLGVAARLGRRRDRPSARPPAWAAPAAGTERGVTRRLTKRAAERRRARYLERVAEAMTAAERVAAAVDYLRAVLAAAGHGRQADKIADDASAYLASLAHDEDQRRGLL